MSEQELYVKGSERRPVGGKGGERASDQQRVLLEHHLLDESRRRGPSIGGKGGGWEGGEEETRGNGSRGFQFSSALRRRQPRPEGGEARLRAWRPPVSYSIRRAGLRFAMAFPRP